MIDRDAIVETMAKAISADHSGDLPEIAWQHAKARGETARYYSDSSAALDAALPMIGKWLAKECEEFGLTLPLFDDATINEKSDDAACLVQEQISARIRALCAGGKE